MKPYLVEPGGFIWQSGQGKRRWSFRHYKRERAGMNLERKLKVLDVKEFNFIANKDPNGSYSRKTREELYWIIEKLRANPYKLSELERRLHKKFQSATFMPLEEKDKRVKFEVAKYRLSANVKRTVKLTALVLSVLLVFGLVAYEFVLNVAAQQKVDVAYFAGLRKLGLVSEENVERIEKDLTLAAIQLQKTRQNNLELSRMVEQMILNNRVTENLKYIIKQVYNDPRAEYRRVGKKMALSFNGKKIADYKTDPKLWYILGIVETGVLRVYYDNEEILEIEAIFGRKGEETPTGEYAVKNKIYEPTWYKKEKINGVIKVRTIPFGDPDHEIGHWWMGMQRLGNPVPGSYGIHGVNVTKANEFVKKNFDWRSGSAGCPNIQDGYLHFLAKMVPIGTRVNIVKQDKRIKPQRVRPPSAA